MSRIGQLPINIPKEVSFTEKSGKIVVTGPRGELVLEVPKYLNINQKETGVIKVELKQSGEYKNLYGLFRSLLNNAVIGVSQGWSKSLEMVGVGYRAQTSGEEVTLNIGFSHPVIIKAPPGVTFQVTDNTSIKISGIDKKIVGEIAAKIRSVKPPEPYKGKGIRYLGEIVRKKAGKAVKAVGAPA